MTLHPVLQGLVDAAAASDAPALDARSYQEARAFGLEWAAHMGRGPAIERVEDLAVPVRHGSVPARLYVPAGDLQAFVVFLHGGGWVVGGDWVYDAVGRLVADGMRCAVLLLDYRLAPEAPFPAGLEDSIDALAWARGAAAGLVGRSLPIVVMGDSAGGNLAAVAVRRLRDAGGWMPAAQILVYPVTDCDPTTGSYRDHWDFPLLPGRAMAWFWDHYLPDPAGRTSPDASPLRADDLSGLPPAIVATAEHDPLRDEGEAYAAALRAAGVPVRDYRLDGLAHGFIGMVDLFDEPARLMARLGQDLGHILSEVAGTATASRSSTDITGATA